MDKKNLIDTESGGCSPVHEVWKKVVHLLHHSVNGTVHSETKENLHIPFPLSVNCSDDRWKVCLIAGSKRRDQHCNDDSGIIVYFPCKLIDL